MLWTPLRLLTGKAASSATVSQSAWLRSRRTVTHSATESPLRLCWQVLTARLHRVLRLVVQRRGLSLLPALRAAGRQRHTALLEALPKARDCLLIDLGRLPLRGRLSAGRARAIALGRAAADGREAERRNHA